MPSPFTEGVWVWQISRIVLSLCLIKVLTKLFFLNLKGPQEFCRNLFFLIFKKIYLFIYLAVLGLRSCALAFSS